MTETAGTLPAGKRKLQNVMLGDSNQVISASLATTKRLRSSTVADLPCQVCGKLSKTSAVVARSAQAQAASESQAAGMDLYSANKQLGVTPRSGVVVCEACKKFCSRFSARLSGTTKQQGSENDEWMTKCGCRKQMKTTDAIESMLEKNLADMCRWCRFRRCHALGLVVDNEVKQALKGPIDLHSVPCAVCAAPSSGYHFGVISCEGCKGFFRRTIHHDLESTYVCESGCSGDVKCDVTTQSGRRCKKCRYSKCLGLGMSLSAIRTGRHSYQLRAETQAHIAQLQNSDPNSGIKVQPLTVQQQQTFVTPSQSETSGDRNQCSGTSTPIDLEMPLDNVYADEGALSDSESVCSEEAWLEGVPKRTQYNLANQMQQFLRGKVEETSANFPQVESPESCDIFQVLSGGDSPSLGSSGAGSPHTETVQDAIARMRRPCEKSPYVWLYDSAREYVDLRQPDPRPCGGNSLSAVDKDPLKILDDYFFVTPIVPDNLVASHLPMPDVTRAQWVIRRVVQSSRLIGNITMVRTVVRPDMSPTDVFAAMVGHFDTFSRFVLQFVKSLPGFDSICLQDRTRLFIESMFPLLSAQLSLDYDEVSQTPNICGLEPGPGRQLAFNYFYHLGLMEPSMKDAGISMKQARLCVIEFSMICGLLFFNPDVPGLAEPHRVRRIFDEYQRAAEIFIGRNFAMNGSASAASRIQMFYSQLSYFRSFYRFFSWLLCDFGQQYPNLVSMDPWLSELHGRVSQLNNKQQQQQQQQMSQHSPAVITSHVIAAAASTVASSSSSSSSNASSPSGSGPNSNTLQMPPPNMNSASPLSYNVFA